MADVISPLDARGIVAPLLPSLPSAAIASEPAAAVLPLLSPILRQRVQFLSSASSEPWIRLLSYDSAKTPKLMEVVRSTRLEPHPVSGEVEVDWDSSSYDDGDVAIRYKRIDVETLQALVHLRGLDLVFRLVHCAGDHEGGGSGNGWRIGEVTIPDSPDAFALFGGSRSVADAERAFTDKTVDIVIQHNTHNTHNTHDPKHTDDAGYDDDDDDDDYWARYDNTPARTPAVKRSPAPASVRPGHGVHHNAHSTHNAHNTSTENHDDEADEAYFSQYDSVQPAMDNHDPDEVVEQDPDMPVTVPMTMSSAHMSVPAPAPAQAIDYDSERLASLLHPRPASASSQSSSGGLAVIVAKLEQSAGKREQSEFGVKQHVSRSIKSLYMLSRASGIDREEFEQLVKTELDMLSMMED